MEMLAHGSSLSRLASNVFHPRATPGIKVVSNHFDSNVTKSCIYCITELFKDKNKTNIEEYEQKTS